MRFTYAEAMTDPAYYVPLAQAAETAGYDTMTVADSLCYPRESDSVYPYTADGGREFLEDKPFIEPFVQMSAMAAVTTRLRFTPFVLKLPMRPPLLVAKQATSLAALSGNRLGLGVGSSPWREDYDACQIPWQQRGKRMNEAIDIIRGLMGGEYFEYHGEVFDLPAIKLCPAPTRPVPILVGGHSDAALRRAAQRGDGWMHAGGDAEELDVLLDRLAELRRAEGTAEHPFEIHVISMDAYTPDGVRRLEDKGVTDVIVGFRSPYHQGPDTEPLEAKIAHLERFAESVIAKTRA